MIEKILNNLILLWQKSFPLRLTKKRKSSRTLCVTRKGRKIWWKDISFEFIEIQTKNILRILHCEQCASKKSRKTICFLYRTIRCEKKAHKFKRRKKFFFWLTMQNEKREKNSSNNISHPFSRYHPSSSAYNIFFFGKSTTQKKCNNAWYKKAFSTENKIEKMEIDACTRK